MTEAEIKLLSAKDAAAILGVNPNTVYKLWNSGLLDCWQIHGTKRTNLVAIGDFLDKTKNVELSID